MKYLNLNYNNHNFSLITDEKNAYVCMKCNTKMWYNKYGLLEYHIYDGKSQMKCEDIIIKDIIE